MFVGYDGVAGSGPRSGWRSSSRLKVEIEIRALSTMQAPGVVNKMTARRESIRLCVSSTCSLAT